MWRLYGDSGKGIAIETTLAALKESIDVRELPSQVNIFPVKYLDFFDKSLQPTDCVVEGWRAPLLKRNSFEHEREVRAFVVPVPEAERVAMDFTNWRPMPLRLSVDVGRLVKAIHVSPYSEQPYLSSVRRICEKFGLAEDIVKESRLLSGIEELMDNFLL